MSSEKLSDWLGVFVSWKKGLDGATICYLASEIGAHERCTGSDADSAQVESVCIPARRDGRVVMVLAVGVPDTCVTEKLEAVVVKHVCAPANSLGKFCTSRSVAIIPAIVLTAAVVEDGEQTNNSDVGLYARGEQETIPLDAPPVVWAVHRVARRIKLTGDELPELGKINAHGALPRGRRAKDEISEAKGKQKIHHDRRPHEHIALAVEQFE